MVLTKTELGDALHKEVRILLHLAGKLDLDQTLAVIASLPDAYDRLLMPTSAPR